MAGFPPDPRARPVPASAFRLVVFAFDGTLTAVPAIRRQASDAAGAVMARLAAGPGGTDHRYAAVVAGEHEIRLIPVGTPVPWDLRAAGPGRPDPEGVTVALAGLSAEFLATVPAGLPGSVDVLALVAPGGRPECPDDLRIGLAAAEPGDDLAECWWTGLAGLRAGRRRIELLG
ncbi:hypothetical protein [Actinoplanes rectilineatus]|uniref:hypothetical protein n=1 Tax=Actinoplanes rectilineatus TaxID=113571 RepID=UPI0005F2E568|nr:hypothetical protein [Actinoplanes rectilineatus]